MKQAWGNIKDTTKVGVARIQSDYKDLDVAILKATNHLETPPKEKHVRTIFAYTSAARPRADVAYCIHQIAKRLQKTHTWCVAIKCLMVIHRTLREGDPTFREELINFDRRGRFLNLANFKDESGPAAWDYSGFVRSYALFLEERLECFRVLKYDVEAEKAVGYSQTRDLNTPGLLEQLPALQALLNRLVGCQPVGAATGSHVIQAALGLVLKESFKLYRAVNDGIIGLVDKFFEMSRVDATSALEIYRRAGLQTERLSEFYDMCKGIDLARSFQFPALDPPPPSFLTTMEEYVREAPKSSGPKESYASADESRHSSSSSRRERRESAPPPVKPPEPEPAPPPPPPPPPPQEDLLVDLGGNDFGSTPNASQIEEQNALALAIVPPGGSTAPTFQANGVAAAAGTSGWELALVSAPSAVASSNAEQAVQSQLAGGFDKLTLDSLYDDAIRRSSSYQSGYSTGNPATAGPKPPVLALPAPPGAFNASPSFHAQPQGPPQDPFAASRNVAPPASVQMAAMTQQQRQLMLGQGGQPSPYGMPQQGMGMGGYGMPVQQMGVSGASSNPFANPYGPPPPAVPYGAGMVPQQPAANPYQSNPFGNPNLL